MDKYVRDDKGNTHTLSNQLGEGGQGIVYRVNRNTGHGLAVKAILDPTTGNILKDSKQYKKYARRLNRIMALPQVAHLAIPLTMLHEPYCGYVMRLMEGMEPIEKYLVPIDDIASTLKQKGGLSKRIKLLRSLAAILCDLHSKGIVYGDLSPGNIFVSGNDNESEVWLIDLDNLAYANEITSSIGTPFYRAPEIAKGQHNSIQSDCYSFALIAFECLTFSKPFNGTIMDEEPDEDFGDNIFEKIECGDCQYVHEPDTNNAPKYGISKNLELVMTSELDQLFVQTFGYKGRTNPNHRPSMRTWLQAFEHAVDKLARCEKGHAFLGSNCILCSDQNGKASSQMRYYTLKAYLNTTVLQSPESDDDREDFQQSSYKRLVYEKRVCIRSKDKNTDGISIPIPWRIIMPTGIRTSDSAAFEVCIRKSGCSIEKVFNPALEVKLTRNAVWPDMTGLRFDVIHGDSKFKFEMTKDE